MWGDLKTDESHTDTLELQRYHAAQSPEVACQFRQMFRLCVGPNDLAGERKAFGGREVIILDLLTPLTA